MIEDDLKDAMGEDKSRGRRHPKDAETLRREREIQRTFTNALRMESEADFIEKLREIGIDVESEPEKMKQVLKIWRAYPRHGRPLD